MKQTIKIKVLTPGCAPVILAKGDWIDLKSAADVDLLPPSAETLKKHSGVRYRTVEFNTSMIPLGVAMKLPKGMEAIMVVRSSTHNKFAIMQTNSFGVIDQTYCGPNDEWKIKVIATGVCHIEKGDRICQFKIQPSQKATFWQKVKWLFSNGVKLEFVKYLNDCDRGGFGTTDIK